MDVQVCLFMCRENATLPSPDCEVEVRGVGVDRARATRACASCPWHGSPAAGLHVLRPAQHSAGALRGLPRLLHQATGPHPLTATVQVLTALLNQMLASTAVQEMWAGAGEPGRRGGLLRSMASSRQEHVLLNLGWPACLPALRCGLVMSMWLSAAPHRPTHVQISWMWMFCALQRGRCHQPLHSHPPHSSSSSPSGTWIGEPQPGRFCSRPACGRLRWPPAAHRLEQQTLQWRLQRDSLPIAPLAPSLFRLPPDLQTPTHLTLPTALQH